MAQHWFEFSQGFVLVFIRGVIWHQAVARDYIWAISCWEMWNQCTEEIRKYNDSGQFWSKLRLFCHHFPPLIVAKYLSTMSQWESKSWREIWNWAPGEIRKFDFSTFLNNFKMTIRKVTPTATKVNEKKFWQVPHLKWHVVSSIWGFSWP